MLFSEQVRKLANEENLVQDAGTYEEGTNGIDWTTKVSKNISLSAEKKVLVRWTTEFYVAGGTLSGGTRVLLGAVALAGTGFISHAVAAPETFTYEKEVFLKLAAGSHTLNFQTSIVTTSGYTESRVRIKNICIGIIDFADSDQTDGGSSSFVPFGGTVQMISKTFATGSARKLAVGSVKKYSVVVIVNGVVDDDAVSVMKNAGESNEADRINWKIYVDGTQKSWNERVDDYQATHPTYCEGAYGRHSFIIDASTQVTVRIDAYNGFGAGGGRTCKVYVSIIYSPWVLGDVEHEPFSFSFPQGSTLYVIAEPLGRNPTKTVKIGKKRAASFGDGTDYYSIANGTGILSHSYTFEVAEVANCVLLVGGYGGCIAIIGADVR